ncbi:MAG TPA: class I SAM-dependent methyltransferase [Gemmatales bacterium]|nr:class I SAM-dependent methyltransferase [Gemmatales bacterium]
MSTPFTNSTTRFSTKAEVYAKARPRYPREVVTFLEQQGILRPGNTIIDLGSGTGLSAKPFLQAGYTVIGVEPNDPMRIEGDHYLARYPQFRSVKGTAEATTLPDQSVDVLIAAQVFHYFDIERTRHEAQRILRTPGWFVAMWNHRNHQSTLFHQGYEAILRKYCPEYHILANLYRNPQRAAAFFGSGYGDTTLQNPQQLDCELFEARIESASYIPKPNHPDYGPCMSEMKELFNKHARDGKVQFDLEIWLHWARLN